MNADEILAQLDDCFHDINFPSLDNGFIYPADVRLNIYRNASDWLLIFEELGTNNSRTTGFDSFQNCLYLYGSRLHRNPGSDNADFLHPISGCPEVPLFDSEAEWYAKERASCLMIRDNRITLDLGPEKLRLKNIELIAPPHKDPPAILRSLLPEYREILLASPEERAQRNPRNLPLWMRLDEWFHPEVGPPSESETFRMLATAIATGDKAEYRPTETPNTHWKNWPESGTL